MTRSGFGRDAFAPLATSRRVSTDDRLPTLRPGRARDRRGADAASSVPPVSPWPSLCPLSQHRLPRGSQSFRARVDWRGHAEAVLDLLGGGQAQVFPGRVALDPLHHVVGHDRTLGSRAPSPANGARLREHPGDPGHARRPRMGRRPHRRGQTRPDPAVLDAHPALRRGTADHGQPPPARPPRPQEPVPSRSPPRPDALAAPRAAPASSPTSRGPARHSGPCTPSGEPSSPIFRPRMRT